MTRRGGEPVRSSEWAWAGRRRRSALEAISANLLRLLPAAAVAVGILVAVMLSVPGCPRAPDAASGPPPGPAGAPQLRVLVHSGRAARAFTTGPCELLVDGAVVASSDRALPAVDVRHRGPQWRLGGTTYQGRCLVLAPMRESLVGLGEVRYRGRLEFLGDAGGGLMAVNQVDVESYLAGVLSRELWSDWHDRTYQAQAIAARTYALYERATARAGRAYDLRDDQSSQVYGGYSGETAKSRRAVEATRGIVLAAGPQGKEKVFCAHYSSCCGGRTNNVGVLYGPLVASGPLAGGVECRDCRPAERFRWDPVRVPRGVVFDSLRRRHPAVAALGGIRSVRVAEWFHERPVWLELVGPGDKKARIRAEDVRLALLRDGRAKGLYSMNCPVAAAGGDIVFGPGRGHGHGVGMCQWGAEGMARRGCSVRQILDRYYPGAKLVRAYE